MMAKNAATLLAILFFPAICWAGELKIYDARGILRSVKPIGESAEVAVWTDPKLTPEEIKLENSSGLTADIQGRGDGSGAIIFKPVTEGSWHLSTRTQSVKVTKIEVR